MLRAGAEVIATSRFPCNTASRYAIEPDFETWKHRLFVYGIDLRDLKDIDGLVDTITSKLVVCREFIGQLQQAHPDVLVRTCTQLSGRDG